MLWKQLHDWASCQIVFLALLFHDYCKCDIEDLFNDWHVA